MHSVLQLNSPTPDANLIAAKIDFRAQLHDTAGNNGLFDGGTFFQRDFLQVLFFR